MPDLAPASIPGAFREYVDLTSQPGRALLRFGTAFANVGTAPLVLTADPQATNTDGTQSVLQVMYNYDNDTGKFTSAGTREAGRFVKHSGHPHFHLEGYASYRLVERIGKSGTGGIAYRSDGRAAVGDKVGFCIRNTLETFELEPGIDSDTLPYYYGGNQPPVSCGFLQGLHVGRADVYGSSYDEQWIDITGVKPGKYWVEVTLDAKNAIAESDETNNVTRWRVTIGDSTSESDGVGKDRYDRKKSNDAFKRATDLGIVSTTRQALN